MTERSDSPVRPPRIRTFDDLAARYDDDLSTAASETARSDDEGVAADDTASEPRKGRARATRRIGLPWSRKAAEDEAVEGERGVSPVGGAAGAATPGRIVGAGAMLLVAAVLIAATWDSGDAAERPEREQAPARPVVAFPGPPRLANAATDPNAPVLNPRAPESLEALSSPTSSASGEHVVPALSTSEAGAQGSPRPVGPAPRSDDRRTLYEAAQRSPIIAWSARGDGRARSAAGAVSLATLSAEQASQASGEHGQGHAGSVGESRARLLPDRKFLITAGTTLPCVLQTALDSSVPGYASCIIPRDVLSDNGRVVLLERGTRVLGEYRGGVRQGERRLFVLWTRAVTPAGVAVDLGSPAADALGRSGFDGRVDTRFWDRFGGALLLSIVDDAAYVAGQAATDSQFSNTTRAPSQAAAVALENSIGASPVLRKRQGADVAILVVKDLNFADVYDLRLR